MRINRIKDILDHAKKEAPDFEIIKAYRKGSQDRIWITYICKCGNENDRTLSEVKNNRAKGCRNCKLPDLVGKDFGHWTVKSFFDRNSKNKHRWVCTCSCGKEKVLVGEVLLRGDSLSCGCRKSIDDSPRLQDLTGKVFGNLKVIKRAKNRGKHTMWECECSCGRRVDVYAINLKSGNSSNCEYCYFDRLQKEYKAKRKIKSRRYCGGYDSQYR